MFKRDIGLFTRNSSFFMIRRCSRYTSRTTSGTAPAPRPASASLAPRGGLAAPSNLAFPESERQRSRSAPCEGTRDSPTHRCHILAVVGSRIAER